MAFANRIRLPIKINKPQYPEDKTVYRRADGTTKTLSVTVKKQYQGETDWMPEKWHERLTIALAHDNVSIEGDKYLGGVSKNGDYTIAWSDFLDYPTAKAAFAVDVTPFDNTNSNCMTCEMASQLSLKDDKFTGTLIQNHDYSIDVATNDSICCCPALITLSFFNAAFIASASIDQMGNLSLHTKPSYSTTNGAKLATYRVTCPNGAFDEADVFGDMVGTAPPVCLAPTTPAFFVITTSTALVTWIAPATAPDHYYWQLYKSDAPGILVNSGDTTALAIDLTGLDAATDYVFYVRSQCDPTDSDATASNFVSNSFATGNNSALCGQYQLRYDDPGQPGSAYLYVTYLDCRGNSATQILPNHSPRSICALQTSPGAPVELFAVGGSGSMGVITDFSHFSFSYNAPCP